jgi:hypothetical protein
MSRRPSKAEEERINRLEAALNKKLPPGSRWHQYFCAIFRGQRCDCDQLPPGPRLRRQSGGGGASAKSEEVENA